MGSKGEKGGLWNRPAETLTRAAYVRLQEAKLRALLDKLNRESQFYRRKFKEAGVDPASVRTLDDLRRLPTTDKEDHRRSQLEKPPLGDFHLVRLENGAKLHGSGGTTGKPLLYLDSLRSWNWVSEVWAYCLTAQGVGPGSVVLMPSGYNMFIGFWGAHHGIEKVGGITVPAGATSTERRVEMILEFGCTNFICTPSYAIHMGETAQKMGIDPASTPIVGTHHAAEPGASIPATKRRIEQLWGAKCYDNYGMVELGSSIMYECGERSGMHIMEDQIIAEFIHPETRQPVQAGEEGEIIWTSIGVRSFEALPLVRYRSKDLAVYTEDPCPCGRTTRRLVGGIRGKLDDIKKVRGVNLFPPAIESTLARFEELSHEWEAVIERPHELDTITVSVEASPGYPRER